MVPLLCPQGKRICCSAPGLADLRHEVAGRTRTRLAVRKASYLAASRSGLQQARGPAYGSLRASASLDDLTRGNGGMKLQPCSMIGRTAQGDIKPGSIIDLTCCIGMASRVALLSQSLRLKLHSASDYLKHYPDKRSAP